MPVQAGKTYTATVLNAHLGESQAKGTPALFFQFETPDGEIEHALFITDKTRERIVKTMGECFGVTLDQLRSRTFLDNLAATLAGRECSISTVSEEYKGKDRVRVQWMNPKRKEADGNLTKRAAEFFGGKSIAETESDF